MALISIYLLLIAIFGFSSGGEHIVIVQEKWDVYYSDIGWDYYFTDESGNVYSIDSEDYAKIQPQHTYYIKTSGRPLFVRGSYAYYIEELPRKSE